MNASMSVESQSRWRLLKWPSVGLFAIAVVAGFGQALTSKGTPPDIRTGYNGALSALSEGGQVPIEQLEAALQISVNERHVQRYNLAVALMQAGRPEEAIVHLKAAVARRPDYALAHRDLGQLLLRRDLPAAISHLESAVEHAENDGTTWYLLGNARLMARKGEAAISAYRRAISLGFTRPGVYHNLGLALRDAGQRAEARASFQQALAVDPQYARSKRALAEMGSAPVP